MLAMGMPMIDHAATRVRATDTSRKKLRRPLLDPAWNVVPVTSVIEVQFTMALAPRLVQKRTASEPSENEGISIVVGEAAPRRATSSCLNWSTPRVRVAGTLTVATPLVSRPTSTRFHASAVADRGSLRHPQRDDRRQRPGDVECIDRAMRYCRRERKPFLLEAMVSRLHGHSSSSGAQRNWNETDTLAMFEQKLIDSGAIDTTTVRALKDDAKKEADAAVVQTMQEPEPTRDDVYAYTYAPSEVDAVYPGDYTGLPGAR